jgi:hypothetical protein
MNETPTPNSKEEDYDYLFKIVLIGKILLRKKKMKTENIF